MNQILVYGSEGSTEAVARFLEGELPIEVDRMVSTEDFRDASTRKVLEITEKDVVPIIGKYKIIVLADPLGAMVCESILAKRYPEQRFVSYGWGMAKLIKKLRTVYVLVSMNIRRLEEYQKIKAKCQETEVREPDPAGWVELVRTEWPSKEQIIEEVKSAQDAPIIVCHPELPSDKIRELVDWRGEVMDVKVEMLIDLKNKIGMKD